MVAGLQVSHRTKHFTMHIIDNTGKQLMITDLDAAIAQVRMFVNLTHQDPDFKTLDKELKIYWSHVFEQLLLIKAAAKEQTMLPVTLDGNKLLWMKDFLGTHESVTDEDQIENYLSFYGRDDQRDMLPEALFVFEGNYFISVVGGVYKTHYDEPREFATLGAAKEYLAELEWQDSHGEFQIRLDRECTLIESVVTEYTGGNVYNDLLVLKDGTTIRISDGVIKICKDRTETETVQEVYY